MSLVYAIQGWRVNIAPIFQLNSKVPLTGQELEDFNAREQERVAKEREAAQRAALARSQQLLEADEGDSGDDTDSDEDDDEMAVDHALRGDSDDDMDQEIDPVAKRRGGSSMGHDWAMDDADSARHLSFDIYLKGNVSKAASFFKTTSGATQRFRMYPYVEKGGLKRKVDEFGETLDVGMWLRRGRALDEDAESEEVKEAKRRKREEDEAKVSIPEFSGPLVFADQASIPTTESTTRASIQVRFRGSSSKGRLSTCLHRSRGSQRWASGEDDRSTGQPTKNGD